MVNQQLLNGLNDQLNREVSTLLRYVVQVASIKGPEWSVARDLYSSEVGDELGHAQYLANQIIMLGGTPELTPDLAAPPKDPKAMLRQDAEQERADVRNYSKLAEMADQEGLMDLKLKMEEQAADEDRHGQQMRRLLGGN